MEKETPTWHYLTRILFAASSSTNSRPCLVFAQNQFSNTSKPGSRQFLFLTLRLETERKQARNFILPTPGFSFQVLTLPARLCLAAWMLPKQASHRPLSLFDFDGFNYSLIPHEPETFTFQNKSFPLEREITFLCVHCVSHDHRTFSGCQRPNR